MNYETRLDTADTVSHSEYDAPEGARRKRALLIALGALIVALLIAVVMLKLAGSGEPAITDGEMANTPRVTVISPGSHTVQGFINATGTLAARRELPVGVAGEGGRVVSIPVEPGDWVQAGQVLAVIDRSVQSQQAVSSQAQVAVSQADAELAQANLDRALQLVERGFISQADIDRLTATRDAAVARVRVAEAQFAERRARNAQLNIVAPAAGLLLTRDVEPGQVVSAGSGTLFSIARGGEMEMHAMVDETELATIPLGATGELTPTGLDESFSCQIWQKSPVINEQTRQGTVRCALSYNSALRPGGFATVQLLSEAVVAPMLPESAILSDDRGSFVYIADADNKAERRDVELGMISDDGIVINSGIDGTEKIVVRAGAFLTEGEAIVPVSEETAG